jgi:hypothetical protein
MLRIRMRGLVPVYFRYLSLGPDPMCCGTETGTAGNRDFLPLFLIRFRIWIRFKHKIN